MTNKNLWLILFLSCTLPACDQFYENYHSDNQAIIEQNNLNIDQTDSTAQTAATDQQTENTDTIPESKSEPQKLDVPEGQNPVIILPPPNTALENTENLVPTPKQETLNEEKFEELMDTLKCEPSEYLEFNDDCSNVLNDEQMIELIRSGIDVNHHLPDQESALTTALKHEHHDEIILALIKAGADVITEHPIKYARTAASIKALIDAGANPDDISLRSLIEYRADPDAFEMLFQYRKNIKDDDIISFVINQTVRPLRENYHPCNGESDNGSSERCHCELDHEQCDYDIAYKPQIIKTLLKNGFGQNIAEKSKDIFLEILSNETSYQTLNVLLDAGLDIHFTTAKHETALELAIDSGISSIIDLLIDAGADVNQNCSTGEKPIHLALQNELPPDLIQNLIDKGADVNAITPKEEYALDLLLMGNGDIRNRNETLNIHNEDSSERYCLATLCSNENPCDESMTYFIDEKSDILNILIKAGSNLKLSPKLKKSPIQYALEYNYNETVLLKLLDMGWEIAPVDPPSSETTANTKTSNTTGNSKIDNNEPNHPLSPREVAHAQMLQAMKSLNNDQTDNNDNAIKENSPDITPNQETKPNESETIITDNNTAPKPAESPIENTISADHLFRYELLSLLLKKSYITEIPDVALPLIHKILLDDMDPNDFSHLDPFLATIIEQGAGISFIKSLIECGFDIKKQDAKVSLVNIILKNDYNDEILEFVLNAGANPNPEEAPIDVIMSNYYRWDCQTCKEWHHGEEEQYEYEEMLPKVSNRLKLLSKARCNLNKKDEKGNTALLSAVKENKTLYLIEALANYSDVNVRDELGKTPIMYAKSRKIVEILESAGADMKAKDNNQKSVEDYIKENAPEYYMEDDTEEVYG